MVKAIDSKSIGLCPRRFESYCPRRFFAVFDPISGRRGLPEHFGENRIPKFQVVPEIWPIKDKVNFLYLGSI